MARTKCIYFYDISYMKEDIIYMRVYMYIHVCVRACV